MFKISHKKMIFRLSIICLFAATAVSIAALLTADSNNQNTSARTGNNSAITVNGGETVYYGDGGHTDKYSITNSNGETIRAYCAEASKDWPGGSNTAQYATNSETSNIVKLAIFLNTDNSTVASTAKNVVFDGWSGDADSEYAWTHAIISAAYASDYRGVTGSNRTWVDNAVTALRGLINNNDDAWIMAKNYQLYFAYGSSGVQDVAWIEDNARYGKVNVQKCDKDTNSCTAQGGASLQGITFKIYNDSGSRIYNPKDNKFYDDGALIDTKTTNASGKLTFSDLLANGIKYKIIETATNTSYELTAGQQTVTLSSNGQEENLKFYNGVMTGKIVVNKVDSATHTCTTQGNTNFNGTTFRLKNNSTNAIYYNNNSIASGAVVDTKQLANGSCSVTFNNLPYGSYIIEETAVSSGYTISTASQTVNIPDDNSTTITVVFANNPVHGKIVVNKVDSETGTCVAQGDTNFNGTTFRLKNNSTNAIVYGNKSVASGEVVDTKQLVNGACSVTFDNLPYGSYIIEETAVSDGYTINTNAQTATISDGDSNTVTIEFPNDPIRGTITVNKKDSVTNSSSPQGDATFNGTTFRVVNNSASSISYNDKTIAIGEVVDIKQLTSGAHSVAFNNLPYGSYIVEETEVGEGYTRNTSSKNVTIPNNGSTSASIDFANDPILGTITVNKKDSATHSCTTQGNATFNGTTFRVINNSASSISYNNRIIAKGEVVETQQLTNGACSVLFRNLPYGSYIVEETGVGEGYTRNTSSKNITIPNNGSTNVSIDFENDPILGKLTVNIIDEDTGSCVNTRGLTFNNAKYTVRNRSNNPIIYNKKSIAKGGTIEIKTYTNDNCSITIENLPIGDYDVQQTEVTEGYSTDPNVYYPSITLDNLHPEVTLIDKPFRGDVKFVKMDALNGEPLRDVPFSISALDEDSNIIETHLAVTNEEGVLDTSSSFVLHTNHTNGYDTLYDGTSSIPFSGYGVWFGLDELGNSIRTADNEGALPYGSYIIQELECKSNHFCYDVVDQKATITINAQNQVIDLHDWNNNCAVFSLDTVATDAKDNDKYVEIAEEVTITDKIDYCVKLNMDFTIKGILMDKATGESIMVNGQPVESEVAINSQTDCGSTEMNFTFDASELGGKEIVVFEALYHGDEIITSHEDINDEAQTVEMVHLHTYATNNFTNEKLLPSNSYAEIKDTVEYCLKPGIEYTLKSALMNKETIEGVVIDNKPVAQFIKFTPDEACGEFEMVYKLNTTGLEGIDLVIFSNIYRDDELILQHADLDDADETVTVELPIPAPETGLFTNKNNGVNESNNMVFIVGAAVFISLGGYAVTRIAARRGIFRKKIDF